MADKIQAGRGDAQYMMRLPLDLREELKAAAKANGRSINTEIIARLTGDSETLRDQFAGQAMQALIGQGYDMDEVSRLSWETADAMIAARKAGA